MVLNQLKSDKANSEHTNKRKKVDADDEVEADNFLHFLVIQNSDPDKLLKLSPFAIKHRCRIIGRNREGC